jgi:hypothetical protein
MKIIQVNEYAYLYGGAEQHVFDSCQILEEAGIKDKSAARDLWRCSSSAEKGVAREQIS